MNRTGDADRAAARELADELVAGPEHPDTLVTRVNLAHWTGRSGDLAGARDQLSPAAHLRPGPRPEHPDTLIARNQLVRWTGEAEDAAPDTC